MNTTREKETVITIMVACIVLYSLYSHPVLWQVALVIGIAGILSDKMTHWIHKGWFWIAEVLGYVMSRVILGILFLVVLLPLAALAKLFRKDFMMLRSNYPSYFVERPHEFEPKDLENPW